MYGLDIHVRFRYLERRRSGVEEALVVVSSLSNSKSSMRIF
jgi:hypothetical protein